MVKPIMRDVLFLGQKSIPATEEDLQVGRDLQDTLAANREACVGMAQKRPLRNRRRLPLPARRAENKAVPEHRNRILRLELEKTTPKIHRLASPDLPA